LRFDVESTAGTPVIVGVTRAVDRAGKMLQLEQQVDFPAWLIRMTFEVARPLSRKEDVL
jgi:hypothetical protein